MRATRAVLVTAVMAAMAWAGTGLSQEAGSEPGRKWCGPTGTWFGSNQTFGLEFIVTIDPTGGGCFLVVAEGIEVTPPWEYSTAWRGVIRKTGRHTYSLTQIAYAGPSQYTDPDEGVPDIAGIRGEMTMLGCDHFEIEFEPVEVYAWGQTPFKDDPVATWPPSIASYTRVPVNCGPDIE